jgi:excinuclease UvrABC nuclease subunit
MNDDFFKKILLTKEEKEILENLCQNKVYLRNIFQDNHTELDKLLIQGKYNANAYLQRNRLGQRLSIFDENNLYNCLLELQSKLGLKKIPRKIECYDISHLSGKYVYGSMVTFLDGKPAKKFYRLFKTTKRNDDFANHKEVLERRLRRFLKWEEDSKETPKKTLGACRT